jgi:hypothetical protein
MNTAIAPMLHGFRQAAPQRRETAKGSASASKPRGAPQPDVDLIELREQSLGQAIGPFPAGVRTIAGLSGFFALIQSRDGPDR